jgi:acetyltransferase
VALANNIGYPVAVKICSADISHKTDIGGVVLNLESGEKVRSAFATVVDNARTRCPGARIDGATLQPMVSDVSYELIAGIKKDSDFGPVLLFGLGGILTEIVNDCAMSLPPLNRILARRLIESTRIARVLRGYRNLAPVDMAALEDVLIRLSQLAVDFAEIAELDINPLAVGKERMLALDARVILGPAEIAAPMHMVIAPYPGDQETHIRTAMGVDIFIRPIRPEDAGPLNDLFESLSPRSIYLRFFTPLKRLPRHMLARFTQIDYDREIALVAVPGADPDSEMLGVARVIRERTPQKAEFSVVVQDAWQGKGIGAALLKQCLKIARSRGVIEVWGTVLAENTQMLALGRSLGFKLSRDPGVGEYELRIDLSRKNPAF